MNFLARLNKTLNLLTFLLLGGYTGVKFDSSLSHSSSGLLPGSGDLIPGSLEEMERKFSQMVRLEAV
jgi:hypothetical protein